MTRAPLIVLATVLLTAPIGLAPAVAQTAPRPLPPGPSVADQHRWQAEQHRYEIDRLRLQSDQRQATTRQLQFESWQTRQELNSRRTIDPYVPYSPGALRSPEQERAARQAATERRQTTTQRVGEIDAWLDRGPN